MTLPRRSLLAGLAGLAATPLLPIAPLSAQDALPDARFVGFCRAVNEFELASGNLALQRSANENVRGFASRAIAEATWDAQALETARREAGVSWAPDGRMGPQTQNFLAQLNALQGPAFDAAFVNAQLAVMTEAESQYGAYSQNGRSGPLRRYAQVILPKARVQLEYARRNAAKP